MNPQTQFCHNPQCPARGQLGPGNIRVHSQREQRYRCTTCGRTFAATTDTPFYRVRTARGRGDARLDFAVPRLSDPGHRRRLRAR